MKDLEVTVLNLFLMDKSTVMPVNEEGCFGYLVRGNDYYSAAIPFNTEIEIEERFVGLRIFKSFINYDGNTIASLCLMANDSIDVKKFSNVAADFLSAKNRRSLLLNPFEWIDEWKEIFGDSLKKRKVYDVLGEMIALKYCLERNLSFIWTGQSLGTHDIVGENSIIEVKSTIKKIERTATINSSFQLSVEKPIELFFVRLEKKPFSLSINSLIKELVQKGYLEKELEKALESSGYIKGNRLREETYDLLEVSSYKVDKDHFPLISIDDINELAPMKNIIGYTLQLDLSRIEHLVIFQKQ